MSDDLRVRQRWFSDRLHTDVTVVRWGVLGVPVLVFPSAGGDAEEIERHGLVNACGPLLAEFSQTPELRPEAPVALRLKAGCL